ncbi:class I SAM-dependent methyltransferase [Subtercola frigoramans]|uniref:16S rRNA (Guanine1207-N2)-methyltransferase n=1 Tax=Subtercola frigoramans TaxID=120298 RepID=A0ABS2L4N4_9MICO|nr:class I SAM-dependent methyltransferase [Subtercola frigoramans]MBM7472062.1 16S rRNA (guanine1207-N2)-methyltransferase [Subtercola frigoramans]
MTFSFEHLKRWPDAEAANLFAVDASDRLIVDEADEALSEVSGSETVVIGDRYGALTLGVASRHNATGIRTQQDWLTGEQALANNARAAGLEASYRSLPLGAELLAGAKVVLLQLPRSLAELDEVADLIARFADPTVTVYAGGRIKHITLAMNEVLGASFDTVSATRARQKSRVLVASNPQATPDDRPYPKREFHAELGLTVAAYPGAFAGTSLDIGTRFLLDFLGQVSPSAHSVIDLGCGTGILAAAIAKQRPDLQVLATDQSQAAVESARATMAANGLADRVTVVRDDGLASQPDASTDAVLCNPPFHVGSTVHTGVALSLFRDAGRVLVPGGQLFTVFNSHLAYQSDLRRLVGPTTVLGQNAKFTVTVSTKR